LSVWLTIVGTVLVEVHPATPERWSDLVTVFGRRGKDPAWDWCQLFLRTSAIDPARPVDNRSAMQQQICDAGVPPGVIAYVDGWPVGWSRVGPRDSFPGVRGNRGLVRVLPDLDASAWWVTCFAVDSRHRRSGIGGALLHADVEFARDHGASAVAGHPVDVSALKATKVSGSAIYTGTVALFTAAGFVEVGRTAPTRPVMRREL
jgi:GNAT superfamily N-acetyltransferase